MSTNVQNGLPPAVKDWLDRVIVPALVREYVARLEPEISLAPEGEPAIHSVPAHTATVEEER